MVGAPLSPKMLLQIYIYHYPGFLLPEVRALVDEGPTSPAIVVLELMALIAPRKQRTPHGSQDAETRSY